MHMRQGAYNSREDLPKLRFDPTSFLKINLQLVCPSCVPYLVLTYSLICKTFISHEVCSKNEKARKITGHCDIFPVCSFSYLLSRFRKVPRETSTQDKAIVIVDVPNMETVSYIFTFAVHHGSARQSTHCVSLFLNLMIFYNHLLIASDYSNVLLFTLYSQLRTMTLRSYHCFTIGVMDAFNIEGASRFRKLQVHKN